MTSQPDRPEQVEQSDQTGEESEHESLIDDPDFYRGGASLAVTNPGGFAEPYLVRNRARVVGAWVRGDVSVKGICILFVAVVIPLLVWAILLLE